MRRASFLFIMLSLLPLGVVIQSAAQVSAPSAAKDGVGGVTGHVLCGDTNLPARMASVLLQPVYEAVPAKTKSGGENRQESASVTISQTLLDGSFEITGVKPGKYYLIVEKAGYLSPLAQLTREQLNRPDDEAAALIARLLVIVTVTANHSASADVRIVRGGSISGTVRFDDGSESGETPVGLLRKSKAGKWEPFQPTSIVSFGGMTDDLGRYHFSGLPEGEYLVEATLALSKVEVSGVFGESRSSSSTGGYSLTVFSGGALRERDAKPLKLEEGEQADLFDIEVPDAKFHSVSGNVVDSSGHTVNAATIWIFYKDDNSLLVSAGVDGSDDAFHLFFVPEGEYTLMVTDAKDVTREEIPYPPGTMPPTHTEEKTVREYADAQQPITIKGDMTGVAVTVAAKDVKLTPVAPAQ